MTHFPFPAGAIIGCIENTLDKWTHPLTQSLECHSLSILAVIDDKIISLIEGCAPCATHLYKQGLLRTSACLWLKYEGAVKEDIRKSVYLANKVPLINLVTPICLYLLRPSAMAISDWLSKQAEIRVGQSLQTIHSSSVMRKLEVKNAVVKTCMHAGPVIKLDGGGVQYEGENTSSVRLDDVLKEEVLIGKEATPVDVFSNQMDVSSDNIIEEDALLPGNDTGADDVNAGKAGGKIGRQHLAEEGDESLPDVLEMIESSWLLGTSSFRRNALPVSHKKDVSRSGFNIRRVFFKS